MADEYSHINYSVTDIERYLNGRMTSKEMHELERAALSDPFLADAIEGYREADMSLSYKHLDEISAGLLRQKKEESKVIPIPVKNNGWWRIAASVILLAGVGMISWLLLKENTSAKQQELAQERKVVPASADSVKAEEKQAPPAIAQHVQPVEQQRERREIANANEKVSERRKEAKALQAEAKSAEVAAEKEAAADVAATYEQKAEIDSNPSALAKRSEVPKALNAVAAGVERSFAPAVKNYVFKGRVSDNNQLPVPNATVSLNNTNAGTVTDMDGNFAIISKDSLAKVSVSSFGYANKEVELKPNTINAITISESAESLSETVVMDFVSKKMKAQDSLASPVVGWESFDKYVAEKMQKKYDSTSSLSDLNGDVMIEFLVNSKGNPYNFKVLKSLNEDADKKAVEIIKDGPAWTTDAKRKKGKVTIHF